MCRPTISSSTSKARASTAPVTGSAVITSVTTTPGSTPAASTRVRRSRSVTMPASRSASMTSSDDTRCSDITCAASRTVAVVATATGSRPTRSRTRVLRIALPVDDSCSEATAPLIRLARWASKKASTSGWSVHSRWKSSAGSSRARESSMAVTSKVDGLPWVRLIEPKHDPSPPRSTRLPWASCTSAAPERST